MPPPRRTNWYEYACFVIGEAIKAGEPLDITVDRVTSILASAHSAPARRPASWRLDSRKLNDTFGFTMRAWLEGVGYFLQQIF